MKTGCSLLEFYLEYLPAPKQRWRCVQKAAQLLQEDGLLCIVTPDSSHMGRQQKKFHEEKTLLAHFRNSQQLKSWRQGLSLLGLSKVSYEKSIHFHGLVYRKPNNFLQNLIKSDAESLLTRNREELFYIPQDFSTKIESPVPAVLEFNEEDRNIIKESFSELPDLFDA